MAHNENDVYVSTDSSEFVSDLKNQAQELLNSYLSEGERAGLGKPKIRRCSACDRDHNYFTIKQAFYWPRRKNQTITPLALQESENFVQLCRMVSMAYVFGITIVVDAEFNIHIFTSES